MAQRLRSAVAGHPDCCPIVVVQSPSYNRAAAVVINTVVAILLLVIAIASSLSSASHCAIISCLLPCPSSASSPLAGCCIASPHATASHLPGFSASHHAITSCHAPLAPLVQLIVALPLHMLQYPSPLCRLTWVVTHMIGLHIELTLLGECDVASTTILGMLISNIVLRVDTRAH
jgi:hypothetical protein